MIEMLMIFCGGEWCEIKIGDITTLKGISTMPNV